MREVSPAEYRERQLYELRVDQPVDMFTVLDGGPSTEQVAALCRGETHCEYRMDSGRVCGKPLTLTIKRPEHWHEEMASFSVECSGKIFHGHRGAAIDVETWDYPTRGRWAVFNPDSVTWRHFNDD